MRVQAAAGSWSRLRDSVACDESLRFLIGLGLRLRIRVWGLDSGFGAWVQGLGCFQGLITPSDKHPECCTIHTKSSHYTTLLTTLLRDVPFERWRQGRSLGRAAWRVRLAGRCPGYGCRNSAAELPESSSERCRVKMCARGLPRTSLSSCCPER